MFLIIFAIICFVLQFALGTLFLSLNGDCDLIFPVTPKSHNPHPVHNESTLPKDKEGQTMKHFPCSSSCKMLIEKYPLARTCEMCV